MELESNNILPFLDCLIHSQKRVKCHLEVLVDRKPTHTNHYLHFNSHHPLHVRRGVARCLYDRARSIITIEEKLCKEEHHLDKVLKKNVYLSFIHFFSLQGQTDKETETNLDGKEKPQKTSGESVAVLSSELY